MIPELRRGLEVWERRLGGVLPWREADDHGSPDANLASSTAVAPDASGSNPALLGVMAFALPRGTSSSSAPPSAPSAVAYNAQRSFPAASTIKVYVLQALLERVAAGTSSLRDELVLAVDDQVSGSGVLKALSSDRPYTLLDLATLMIIVSDNTATNLLIDLLGVDEVNESMRRNGWLGSTLGGKLQLATPPPGGKRAPSRTTPADLADYFARLWLGELLPPELTDVAKGIYRQQQYGELGRYLDYDPYSVEVGEAPWRIASKSGSIRGVRNDAGVIEAVAASPSGGAVDKGRRGPQDAPRAPLVVAIMTSGCPDERFHDDNLGAKVLGAVARDLFIHLG